MKVVGLVSGGKDSCYNLMKCVNDGHEIVCLANLQPPEGTSEMDSYMYQTVGHDAIQLYSDAWSLPLYRRTIVGRPLNTTMTYTGDIDNDEVEDLYELMKTILIKHPDIKGVSCGAIMSSYQSIRLESVCARLNLTPLCYLWQREQDELLVEMIESNVHAIIIKVAAMGLNETHLGKTLGEMLPILRMLNAKYGINVCGEGGEYETLVLDCPLMRKKIVLDETKIVQHSCDAFAPVVYLNIIKAHLYDK